MAKELVETNRVVNAVAAPGAIETDFGAV